MTKVLIIGAGPAGLVAAKECRALGICVTIMDKAEGLGGSWNPAFGNARSISSTNISKDSCQFSDLPWPKHAPMHPSPIQMFKYLKGYADHFQLSDSFLFGSTIQSITQGPNKSWEIKYERKDQLHIKEFSQVIVASGIFSAPALPENVDPQNSYVTHASDYKSNKPYHGKNIVVIGSSFTGCEIAADLSSVATVTHIMSSTPWILPKNINHQPLDWPLNLRKETSTATPEEQCRRAHGFFKSVCAKQLKHGLNPTRKQEEPPFITISDAYLDALGKKGIKIIQDRVASIVNNTVNLCKGPPIKTNHIICATGYKPQLGFLPDTTRNATQYDPADKLQPLLLYKQTLAPMTENLFFIGVHRDPRFTISELQARWIAALIAKQSPYPSQETITRETDTRKLAPKPQFAYHLQTLADSIGAELGIKINLQTLKDSDPELYDALCRTPVTGLHYRSNTSAGRAALIEQYHQMLKVIAAMAIPNTQTVTSDHRLKA